MERLVVGLLGDVDASSLDGKTFQVHVLPGNRLLLSPVTLHADPADLRCPVIVGGERCGKRVGHSDKHCWANGD